MDTKNKKALIYCRVSSERQVNEGHGLDSQESRCRQYAENKGYAVTEIFRDEGISGGLFERPAMKQLISFMDKTPFEKYIVIFDDLTRFARDVKVHLELKLALKSRGATFECLNFNFEDSPEGELSENISMASAQYERQKNRRQVMQKQKARLEAGYWCFCNADAFKFTKDPVHGKLLVRNEPFASIYKDAIEQFEQRKLISKEQVKEFIYAEYQRLNLKRKKPGNNTVERILKNPLFAGYVEYLPWGVTRRLGHHKGFISPETFDNVQEILAGRTLKRTRKDYSLDFPLRGYVLCAECQEPITASWSKGRTAYYAYYSCKTVGCKNRYKTIRKINIDVEFEKLLEETKTAEEILNLTKRIMQEVWNNQKVQFESISSQSEGKKLALQKQIDGFMGRIANATNEQVIKAYENQVEKLMQEKTELETGFKPNPYTESQFGTALNKVFNVIQNPLLQWKTDNITDKETVLNMYFNGKLNYDLNYGFGTSTLAPEINLIKDFGAQKVSLVEMRGIEPLCCKAVMQKYTSLF